MLLPAPGEVGEQVEGEVAAGRLQEEPGRNFEGLWQHSSKVAMSMARRDL